MVGSTASVAFDGRQGGGVQTTAGRRSSRSKASSGACSTASSDVAKSATVLSALSEITFNRGDRNVHNTSGLTELSSSDTRLYSEDEKEQGL